MAMDLFGSEAIDVDIPDARIRYFPNVYSEAAANELFADINQSTPWREEEVLVWGKRHKQPRLIAWYGDPGASYSYSGTQLAPLQWTEALLAIKEKMEGYANAAFNSVLLNLYRDQNDKMGWHSDDEPELGRQPTIASLSLGETRVFLMKHKTRKELPIRRFELQRGSLLVMAGPTQQFWQHSVREESRPMGARINLTFRHIRGAG